MNNYCWILPNNSILEVPYGSVHGLVAIKWAEENIPDKVQELLRGELPLSFVTKLGWIRVHYNSFQVPDLNESTLARLSSFVGKNFGSFESYYDFTMDIAIDDSFEFSHEELEEVDYDFRQAIKNQKMRQNIYKSQYNNLITLKVAQKFELERLFQIAGEIYQQREDAALRFIQKLEQFPEVESWKGWWTLDFGNGVFISISNHARSVYTDQLNSGLNKFGPEDERRPDIWYIENIHSTNRGSGNASNAIAKLKQLADESGVVLRLYPIPTDKKGLKQKQLVEWYKRKGWQQLPKNEITKRPSLYYELLPSQNIEPKASVKTAQTSSKRFIDRLRALPRADYWKGIMTLDFGNGVYISMSSKHRDVYTDELFDDADEYYEIYGGERRNDIWYIENIQSHNRGSGNASKALAMLKQMADECGVTLRLYPNPTGKNGLDKNKLTDWYQRQGWQQMPSDERNLPSKYYERNPNKTPSPEGE